MQKSQWIAGVITALIVLSSLAWVFADDLSLPKVPEFSFELPSWEIFSTKQDEPSAKKTKTKTRKSSKDATTGIAVDSHKGVKVYHNGAVRNVFGRNLTADGYNLGLKYQCVEFVKRFYYEAKKHKMPNSYGNAKEFFNASLSDGQFNKDRGLVQFTNGSMTKPRVDDILVFGSAPYNSFGHVAIVSKVQASQIEIVQQNPGPTNPSREYLPLKKDGAVWRVTTPYVVGWLGKR